MIYFSSNWEGAGSDETMILLLSRALLEALASHLTDNLLEPVGMTPQTAHGRQPGDACCGAGALWGFLLLSENKGTSSVLSMCREASKPLPKPTGECSDRQREKGKEMRVDELPSWNSRWPRNSLLEGFGGQGGVWVSRGLYPMFKCMGYTWSGPWAEKVPCQVTCHFSVRDHRFQWRISIYTVQYISRNSGASRMPWCSACIYYDLPVNFTPAITELREQPGSGLQAEWTTSSSPSLPAHVGLCLAIWLCHIPIMGNWCLRMGKMVWPWKIPVWLPSGFSHQLDKYTLKYS